MTVACHDSDLDRILDVLLENAIAYAPGAPIELSADGPLISVRDHGPGPVPGEEEAVFERFHRGRAALAGGVSGTGLGLAIARELARRWGGDVTFGPAPGGGALVQVRLVPVAVCPLFTKARLACAAWVVHAGPRSSPSPSRASCWSRA